MPIRKSVSEKVFSQSLKGSFDSVEKKNAIVISVTGENRERMGFINLQRENEIYIFFIHHQQKNGKIVVRLPIDHENEKKAREEEKRPVDSNLKSIIKCACVFAYAARVRLSFLV